MLENLRKKSLTKTYNDPTHQVSFELGYAHYENHLSLDQYKQRFSKKKTNEAFSSTFTQVSKESRLIPFSLGNINFNMIACPSGSFTMGHEDEDDNKPRIEIIDRPFLLGETEITQELYEKVMGYNPSRFKDTLFRFNSKFNYPVEWVSWQNAIKFCNELSQLQGLDLCYTKNSSAHYDWSCDFSKNGYRLPKEKEWEYAAKASTKKLYAGTSSTKKLEDYARFNDSLFTNNSTDSVKMKAPNDWGFYDMTGNVEEWCWDKYNPNDPNLNAERVYRGGSCNDHVIGRRLRITRRSKSLPSNQTFYLGFRVCRSIVN